MTFYHATFRKHLDSIYRYGLGGLWVKQNWEGCERGVYLATAPELCVFVMIDQYSQFGDPKSNPFQHLKEIVVIVIDDTRVDRSRLGPDPLICRPDVFLYPDAIDVHGMPVLDLELLAKEWQ